MKHFIVEEKNHKARLDKFLVEKLQKTRSQIQKMITSEQILVNNKKAKVHQFLSIKDKVSIEDKEKVTSNQQPVTSKRKKILKKMIPKVIKKTKDYLIIEKPSGLLVHATSKDETDTLVNWLVEKYPEVKKIADVESLKKRDKIFRPGIVHRLDREVSGLMLIALNQDAYDYYKQQFQKRIVKKEYTALVFGHLPQPKDLIEFEIGRRAGGGRMAAHPKGSGLGKYAQTEYTVVREFQKCSLVTINLHTGRTNQIRVHFFALKNPIVGDSLYKLKQFKPKFSASRILLHANKLEFIDRTGATQTLESELPPAFDETIKQLK